MKKQYDYALNQELLEQATNPANLESFEMQLKSMSAKMAEWASDDISLKFQLKYKTLFYKVLDCEKMLQTLLAEKSNQIDTDWISLSYREFEIQFEEVNRRFQEFCILYTDSCN